MMLTTTKRCFHAITDIAYAYRMSTHPAARWGWPVQSFVILEIKYL